MTKSSLKTTEVLLDADRRNTVAPNCLHVLLFFQETFLPDARSEIYPVRRDIVSTAQSVQAFKKKIIQAFNLGSRRSQILQIFAEEPQHENPFPSSTLSVGDGNLF